MFHNKTILVTGGTRGIGKAIAEDFAAQGGSIVFTYLSSHQAAEEMLANLSAQYPDQKFSAKALDARDSSEVGKFIEYIESEFGSIDVLVNNAGITRDAPIISMKEEDWMEVIDTNLNAVFHLTKRVVFLMMKQQNGAIINVSSVSGIYGNIGQTNYASSKAGLIGFTKALAKETARFNMRVNAIAAGFIDTDMTKSMDEKKQKQIKKNIGLGRLGTAQEVANTVTFLASDKASYITGQALQVDGGIIL